MRYLTYHALGNLFPNLGHLLGVQAYSMGLHCQNLIVMCSLCIKLKIFYLLGHGPIALLCYAFSSLSAQQPFCAMHSHPCHLSSTVIFFLKIIIKIVGEGVVHDFYYLLIIRQFKREEDLNSRSIHWKHQKILFFGKHRTFIN